jgi:hypothetical protein
MNFRELRYGEVRRILLLETVWQVAGGFLIACVSCFKRARMSHLALFWLLATLQIEAYWDFPDSLSTRLGELTDEEKHGLTAVV